MNDASEVWGELKDKTNDIKVEKITHSKSENPKTEKSKIKSSKLKNI